MPLRIWVGATARRVVALGCLSALLGASIAAQPTRVAAAAHAPASQKECTATSKALSRQAQALAKRTKQIIPREFDRVSANLDDYCDGGDFEKARVSINPISAEKLKETVTKLYTTPADVIERARQLIQSPEEK